MEATRYIQNPFIKIFKIVNPDNDQLYNQLLKLLQEFFTNVKIPTAISISSEPGNSREDASVYTGTAGYIIMFLRLHDFFKKSKDNESEMFTQRSHLVGDQGVNQLTDPIFYLKLAQEQYRFLQNFIFGRKRSKSTYSYYMSEVSVWVCGMHLGFKTNDQHLFRQNQKRILECYENMKANIQKQYWQLLYGVPGFLYALIQLQKHYQKAEEPFKIRFSSMVIEITHLVIRQGIINYQNLTKNKVIVDKLPPDFRLVYDFYKSEYLGGAHGIAGNISVILSAMKYNDFGEDTMKMVQLIKGSIIFLLKHLINGNYSYKSYSKDIKLVHFCHGAPGIVTALAKFTQMFPQIGVILGLKEVINVNLEHIWKYGVLKKGFGLCHGISGNAYSFLSPSLHQVFHDRVKEFVKKAQFFALLHEQPDVMKQIRTFAFKDRHTVGRSDQPYSLMVGIAGDVCFVIDVLNGSGYFPGFDI